MKNRLLFVIPSFNIGGITSSLASLTEYIKDDFQIEIFCRNNPKKISTWHGIKVLDENIWLSIFLYNSSPIWILINKILRILRGLLRFFHIDIYPLYCFLGGRKIKSRNYNSIISFHEDINSIVCYIPAKKRIAWTHSVYSRYLSMKGNTDQTKYLKRFASIVFVSEFAKNDFIRIMPNFRDKATVIYNIIDQNVIKAKSEIRNNELEIMSKNSFNIISIGRLDPVKQFNRIPSIADKVRTITNKSFKWFIIGEGDKQILNEINMQIKNYNLENIVILLGSKQNVFPYIKQSDLLVHTSLSETCSLVVNEALSLGVPVVVNNYGCASEFVANKKFGFIIPNDDMYLKIAELIDENNKMTFLKKQLKNYRCHNIEAITAFKRITK